MRSHRPASPATAPSTWWIWIVYVALFVASVPWYVPAGSLRTWLGLPAWVVLSLCATTAISVFTLFVVRHIWRDDDR